MDGWRNRFEEERRGEERRGEERVRLGFKNFFCFFFARKLGR